MVSFGKWRLGHWHERSAHYDRLETADKAWHYQALQEFRRHPIGIESMRRLLDQRGMDNVFRLGDTDIMELIADRLKSGEICLFEFKRMTLQELRDAALETKVAKEFLEGLAMSNREEPLIAWGKAEYRSAYDPATNRIFLHQHFLKDDGMELSDNEWKQAIVMELGNALNDARFQIKLNGAIQDPPSRDEFTAAVENQEFETRMRLVRAYNDGEFCKPTGTPDCISVFDLSVTTFAQFLRDPKVQQHRNQFAYVWDRYCKLKYEQRLKPKAKPKAD